jgi:hypothetical protein
MGINWYNLKAFGFIHNIVNKKTVEKEERKVQTDSLLL